MKSKITRFCLLSCLVAAISVTQAATFNQTNLNPNATTGWNDASVWGGNAVTSGNDYSTVAGALLGTAFAANGTTWNINGTIRNLGSTTFAGDHLIVNANTRVLEKGASASPGASTTANIVLNGGFIHAAPNQGGVVNYNGTIVAQGALNAIGTNPFSGSDLVFNINSTITGAGTIQLVEGGDAGGTRTSHINLLGNYSAFTGTFYLSTSTTVSNNVAAGSNFSIASGSAPLATLNLATTSNNFQFNLNSNLTFGSVIVGATTLAPGTYGFTELSALAPGKFTNNLGSITVVPEPSTTAIGVTALLLALAVVRRRHQTARA